MIARIARGQHGVVSRQQLLSAGVSDRMIGRRLALERLHRLYAGAYSVSDRPGQLGRFQAAVLACGEGALLSHRSAAALWDLINDRGPVDVLILRGGPRAQRGLRVHATRSLYPADVVIHQGIRCTSVARTIVDVGAVLAESELRPVLERAIRLRLFDNTEIRATLARANGRRGTGTLRELLDQLEDAPTRSELERRFLDLIRSASLPSPITNGLVSGYEVDFHWPDARLIVETEGRETHDNPFAFERDRQRDLDLKLGGWEVIRITWRQLKNEPTRIVALLRAKLGSL